MSSGALFGSSNSGPGSTGGNKHLVEMRAGKMNLKGTTVSPDTRKGLLYVYQSEDTLMHFCWQDRTTGIVEDDLIIFPDDCEYLRVPQCTTGRVYLLKFKSSSRRFFFWLQEPRTDKDEDHCKRVNDCLNNPGNVSATVTGGQSDPDLQSLLNNMSQTQLMQLFGGAQIGGLSNLLGTINRPPSSGGGGGSARTTNNSSSTPARFAAANATAAATAAPTPITATTPSTVTATPAATAATPAASSGFTTPANTAAPVANTKDAPPRRHNVTAAASGEGTPRGSDAAPAVIRLADLQSFLQGMSGGASGATDVTGDSVDLSTALDTLTSIMEDNETIEQLQDHLPHTDGTAHDQLRSTLQSPQFQQAVSQFSSALESGQLGPVVSQLLTNPDAVTAANQGNMQNFFKALEKAKDATAAEGVVDGTSGSAATKTEGGGKEAKPKKEDSPSAAGEKNNDNEGMELD